MKAVTVESPDDIHDAAGVPERVASGVWDGLVETARRVGTQQAAVFVTRNPATHPSFEGDDDDPSELVYSAVSGRLVYRYNSDEDDGPADGVGVESQHIVGRFDPESDEFDTHLSSDGRVVLSPLNNGGVFEEELEVFVARLDPDVDITPITRVVVRMDDHEFVKEFDGIGHDMDDDISGRLHKERFPLLERYVAYINEGDTVYSRMVEGGEDSEVSIDTSEMDGIVFDDRFYAKTTVQDAYPDGFRTTWGSYGGEDLSVVDVVSRGIVLPRLAVNQEPTEQQRLHNETSAGEGRSRPPRPDRPDAAYGDDYEQ